MLKRKLIQVLKNTINSLEDDLQAEKRQNNQLINDNIILLENSRELRAKIVDLENNVEFLYNNLSAQKKKLLRS